MVAWIGSWEGRGLTQSWYRCPAQSRYKPFRGSRQRNLQRPPILAAEIQKKQRSKSIQSGITYIQDFGHFSIQDIEEKLGKSKTLLKWSLRQIHFFACLVKHDFHIETKTVMTLIRRPFLCAWSNFWAFIDIKLKVQKVQYTLNRNHHFKKKGRKKLTLDPNNDKNVQKRPKRVKEDKTWNKVKKLEGF